MLIQIPFSAIKKIRIVQENLTASEIYTKYKPDYFINGVLYDTHTGKTITRLRVDGVDYGYLFTDTGIGIVGNKLEMTNFRSNVQNIIGGSPILRKDNRPNVYWGNTVSDYINGTHCRSAIGFDSNSVYLYASDNPVTIVDLAEEVPGIDALNLDGGGSCHLQAGTQILKSSTRRNASWILIWGDSMKTNIGLVEHCKRAVLEKWKYIWGTYGLVLTQTLWEQKLRQYPTVLLPWRSFVESSDIIGQRTVDCIGLIKSYLWWDGNNPKYTAATDINADMMYSRAAKKGKIETIPEVLGLAVWKKGHIGVYIGNGQVIEAKGTKYGVVQTPLTGIGANAWTHWLEIPYIEYEEVNDMIFKDVPETRWSYHEIKRAKDLGLIAGNTDGTFNPTGNVTREQVAVLLVRLYDKLKEELE